MYSRKITGVVIQDTIWAKYWYNKVHKSSGFIKYKVKDEVSPKHLDALLKECLPYYKELIEHSI